MSATTPSKPVPADNDKGHHRDASLHDDSSNSSASAPNSVPHDDTSASGEELNIFQAILLNNEEVLEQLLDTTKSDYIVHLKAVDSIGRYVIHLKRVECRKAYFISQPLAEVAFLPPPAACSLSSPILQ